MNIKSPAVVSIAVMGSLAAIILLIASKGWIDHWSGGALAYFGTFAAITIFLALCFWGFKARHGRTALLCASALFLMLGVGSGELASVLLFSFSSFALGRIVLSLFFARETNRIGFLSSFSVGLAIYILLFSLVISTTFNNQLIYLGILSLPIIILLAFERLFNLKSTIESLDAFSSELNSLGYWKFVGFLILFTYVGAHSFFPTMMWDDNVLHLSVWAKISNLGTYQPDVISQIWSAAPSSIDVLHAIVSLISQSDSRAALNLFFYIMTALTVYQLTGMFTNGSDQKLIVTTLFVSTPMIANLLLGLQTDLLLGMIAIIGCQILFTLKGQFSLSGVVSILFVVAICSTAKLPAILIGLGLILSLFCILFEQKSFFRSLDVYSYFKIITLLCVAVAIALFPYIKSFLITGNPVFPLYNGIFKSDFFAHTNFLDARFNKGATFESFFGMFFNTSLYFESKTYTAGFQYFLLFPISIVILLFYRRKELLLLGFPLFCYAIPMFLTLQYVRYFYEVFPIISVLFGVFLIDVFQHKISKKVIHIALGCYAFLNLLFLPGVSASFGLSPIYQFDKDARAKYLSNSAPEFLLNQEINRVNKSAKVLFDLNRPYGATLSGTPFYNAWYSPSNFNQISAWDSIEKVEQNIQLWNIDFAYSNIAHQYTKDAVQRNLLREYLVDYGYPQFQVGPIVAYKIGKTKAVYSPVISYGSFSSLEGFDILGNPLLEAGTVSVSSQNIISKGFSVESYRSFKYQVTIECSKSTDEFIAQINWNTGEPYYKLVGCKDGVFNFSETGLIPRGVSAGVLYMSARGDSHIKISAISVGAR